MQKLKDIVLGGLAQFKKLWLVFLFLYLPILLLFIVIDIVSRASDELTLSYFTRDVTAIGNLPFYAGVVSQLGAMLWSAALAVCVLTVTLLKSQNQNGRARRFLIQAAILTAVLLLDDIFLFHEDIGPDYFGISEKVIAVFYFLLCLAFLVLNMREILSSEYSILGLALAMFGASMFLDAANLDKYDEYGILFSDQFQIFLEDGFKFVGIATWLLYFARYGIQRLRGQDATTSSAT